MQRVEPNRRSRRIGKRRGRSRRGAWELRRRRLGRSRKHNPPIKPLRQQPPTRAPPRTREPPPSKPSSSPNSQVWKREMRMHQQVSSPQTHLPLRNSRPKKQRIRLKELKRSGLARIIQPRQQRKPTLKRRLTWLTPPPILKSQLKWRTRRRRVLWSLRARKHRIIARRSRAPLKTV